MGDLTAHVEALQAAARSDGPAESKGPAIPVVSSEVSVFEAAPAPVPWD